MNTYKWYPNFNPRDVQQSGYQRTLTLHCRPQSRLTELTANVTIQARGAGVI